MMDETFEPAPLRTDWALMVKVILGFWALHLASRAMIAVVGRDAGETWDPAINYALSLGFLLSFPFAALLALAARRGLAFGLGAAVVLSLPVSLLYASTELVTFYHLSPMTKSGSQRETLADGTVIQVDANGNASYTKPGSRQRITVKLPTVKQQILSRAVLTVTQNTSAWYFFYFGLGAFFIGMSNASRLRAAERRGAELLRLAQEAQLQALRYQINPHFLFNTLNSLSALVMANRASAAEAMILKLSQFFRTTLALDPTGDITLREELALQRLYLDIEAVRFPERLRVTVDAPAALLEVPLPPLLLQPLVENAIKHGVARRAEPTTIVITAEADDDGVILSVENDIGPSQSAFDHSDGTNTGLRNVAQRLERRFGSAARLDLTPTADRYRAVITLPRSLP